MDRVECYSSSVHVLCKDVEVHRPSVEVCLKWKRPVDAIVSFALLTLFFRLTIHLCCLSVCCHCFSLAVGGPHSVTSADFMVWPVCMAALGFAVLMGE